MWVRTYKLEFAVAELPPHLFICLTMIRSWQSEQDVFGLDKHVFNFDGVCNVIRIFAVVKILETFSLEHRSGSLGVKASSHMPAAGLACPTRTPPVAEAESIKSTNSSSLRPRTIIPFANSTNQHNTLLPITTCLSSLVSTALVSLEHPPWATFFIGFYGDSVVF